MHFCANEKTEFMAPRLAGQLLSAMLRLLQRTIGIPPHQNDVGPAGVHSSVAMRLGGADGVLASVMGLGADETQNEVGLCCNNFP